MLRPQDTARRDTRSLDGLWDFALDTDKQGRDAGLADSHPRASANGGARVLERCLHYYAGA